MSTTTSRRHYLDVLRALAMLLGLGLLLVFPVSLAFSFHLDWTRDLVTDRAVHTVIAAALEVIFTWLMVFGLIGLCRRLLARERHWIRYVSDASYWLYLAHLPLIITAQVLVQEWPLPAIVKFGVVLVGITAMLMVIYRYAVRYTWIGRMLNGPRQRPGEVQRKDGAAPPGPTGSTRPS